MVPLIRNTSSSSHQAISSKIIIKKGIQTSKLRKSHGLQTFVWGGKL
jgi:hypothetical protein